MSGEENLGFRPDSSLYEGGSNRPLPKLPLPAIGIRMAESTEEGQEKKVHCIIQLKLNIKYPKIELHQLS